MTDQPRVISRFHGEFDFLSNFYPSPIVLAREPLAIFPTAEHAFQAMKVDPEHPEFARLSLLILAAPTPADAKRIGRSVPLRADWDTYRLKAMRQILDAKFAEFAPGTGIAARLRATGDAVLIEGNTWNDTYWGVDLRTGRGENHLGRLLMKVRGALQDARRKNG